jgi:asparagine synthase (glutamine-hydrolysing)
MCGIFAVHGVDKPATIRTRCIALSKKQRHRGPDWSGCYVGQEAVFVHERLAIVGVGECKSFIVSAEPLVLMLDTDTGAQPLVSHDGKVVLAVNGEIYNHIALRHSVGPDVKFRTHSDCEVIIPLYQQHGKALCGLLDGMFSFVLLDESVTPSRVIAARDPIGITTLYQGWSSAAPGTIWFSSELKALHDECDRIRAFPPGHVYDSADGSTTRYYTPAWWDEAAPPPTTPADLTLIRETLEAAVRKRLMSEVPFGVLLSGGLDSSLIASIAMRETEKVAQKHYDARKKKLAEHRSGPPTPRDDGLIDEEGQQLPLCVLSLRRR